MIALLEYLDGSGKRPFQLWFEGLDDFAALKVQARLERLANGNLSNVKSVGSGVHELKIDFGPGYRVYFGRDGASIVVLLGGGTKKRQQRDIGEAQIRWANYKRRKK